MLIAHLFNHWFIEVFLFYCCLLFSLIWISLLNISIDVQLQDVMVLDTEQGCTHHTEGRVDSCDLVQLILYTLISLCIFSILFIIHFLRCWKGEFVEQSRTSLVGDHFLYPHDLNVWFRGDLKRKIRCQSLLGVKGLTNRFLVLCVCSVIDHKWCSQVGHWCSYNLHFPKIFFLNLWIFIKSALILYIFY